MKNISIAKIFFTSNFLLHFFVTSSICSVVSFSNLSAGEEEKKKCVNRQEVIEVTSSKEMVFPPPFERKKKIPAQIVDFPALCMSPYTETGADLIDFSGDRTFPNSMAIEFPYLSLFDEGPSAEFSFEIPHDYKKELQLSISLNFLSPYSLEPINGTIKFTMSGNILHSNGETEVIKIGEGTLHRVKSANTPVINARQARSYYLKVGRMDKIRKGDSITVTITRDNSIDSNFEDSIFILSMRLVYNIPTPVIL